jgi:hypothetical protein
VIWNKFGMRFVLTLVSFMNNFRHVCTRNIQRVQQVLSLLIDVSHKNGSCVVWVSSLESRFLPSNVCFSCNILCECDSKITPRKSHSRLLEVGRLPDRRLAHRKVRRHPVWRCIIDGFGDLGFCGASLVVCISHDYHDLSWLLDDSLVAYLVIFEH